MKNFKLKNILHHNSVLSFTITQLSKTVVGQKFTDADGSEKQLTDSKYVAKRKRDLRGASSQILETAQNETGDRIKLRKNVNKEALINADFIEFATTIISKEIANFVCSITGSPRYDRIVTNFVFEVLSNTLLNFLDLPEEAVELNDATVDSVELKEPPKSKGKK